MLSLNQISSGVVLVASLTLVMATSCAMAADERLQRLADYYSTVNTVRVSAESTSLIAGHRRHYRCFVSGDGTFGFDDFQEVNGKRRGKDWDVLPSYFVYYGDGLLRVADGTGSEYRAHQVQNLASESPGPVQWIFCPWPVIPKMCRWLESATDLVVAEDHGKVTASSDSARLSITWQGNVVQRVLRGVEKSGRYQLMEFGGFGQEGRESWIPATAHEVLKTGVIRNGEEIIQDVQYAIAVQTNEAVSAVRFDAASLEVDRYDEESGDVIAPDGKVLFNKREVEKRLLSDGPWGTYRSIAIGLVAVGAVVAVVLGVRKGRT